METSLNLDRINFQKPKDNRIFQDSTENWLAFRKIRFANAGDGEYTVIRGLDLSNMRLNDFPVDHLAFVQCNLDGTLFRNTYFQFGTTFINCSMRNTDLTETLAADVLFTGCNLTDVKISSKPPYAQWASIDLESKDIPTIFRNCIMGESTKQFLIENRCIIDESNLTDAQQLHIAANINDKLNCIATAPILYL